MRPAYSASHLEASRSVVKQRPTVRWPATCKRAFGEQTREAVEKPFSSDGSEPAKVARPLRVLVADDDRDTVLTLVMLLREEGYDVQGVYSGREVMRRTTDFAPDVVILDINMPEGSGWEIARTIRARPGKGRPMLIGISGEYKACSDRVLSQIVGLDYYVVKPYAPAELLALIAPLRVAGPIVQ